MKKPAAKRPRGRQTVYTKAVAKRICDRLAAGESLRAICKDPGMPPERTVRWWVIDNRHGFATQYEKARNLGLDCMADQVFEIADDASMDVVLTPEGPKVVGEVVARSRLRFDARRWYLSKMAPKRYGDKLLQEHSGPDGGPIKTETTEPRPSMTPDQWLKAHGVDLKEIADGVGPAARAANQRTPG